MKCSVFAAQILAHVESRGDGEVVMSGDRQAPTLHSEGADCLVIDQRVAPEQILEKDLD